MDFRANGYDGADVLPVLTPPSSIFEADPAVVMGFESYVISSAGPEFSGDSGMYFIFVFCFYILSVI